MKNIRHLFVFIIILITSLLISEIFYVSNNLYASKKNKNTSVAKNSGKEKNHKGTKPTKNTSSKSSKTSSNKKGKTIKQILNEYKDPVDYAKDLIDHQDTRKAFSFLTDYLSKTPSPEGYFQMGRIYYLNGDYKTAHQNFKKASKYIDPDSAYDYGIMYYNLKNYYQAVKGFSAVDKDSPLKNIANFYAGVCYLELNRISDAEKYFRRAKKLPGRYEDLKQRYLNAIQSDTQGSTSYTLSSRMALPPMNDINSQSVFIDEKGEKHTVEVTNVKNSGFKFPTSLRLEGGVGGVGQRKTYVDVVETTEFKIDPIVEIEGRFEPNYFKTLRSKRDLTVSLPLNLKLKYEAEEPKVVSGSDKSFTDNVKTDFSFKPNLGVPIFTASTIGVRHDLSLELKGLDTEKLKFKNFLAVYYETRISETSLSAEGGFTYELSGLASAKSSTTQAEAVPGIKGIFKVNGGADSISYKISADILYNLQTEQNISDSVTNDMIIKGEGTVSLNGEHLGLDVGGKYTKKVDNESAVVEGSKTEEELNSKFRVSFSIVELDLKGKYIIYPEYIYQNDNGYITTTGNSSSVEFVVDVVPIRWIKLSGNIIYESNDYGIDEGWAINFYSKEQNHYLSKLRYGVYAKVMFNF